MSSASDSKIRYSVVVSAHHGESKLRDCLASLDAQTFDRSLFEVIVVHNDTAKGLVAAAAQAGATCLAEHESQSPFAARNLGVRSARGELIAFLDSDCVAHPKWLEKIDLETDDATIGCLAGEIISSRSDPCVEQLSGPFEPLPQRYPVSGQHFKSYALIANATYRVAVFKRIGLFDPSMESGGDAVLGWRMLDQTSFRIKFVPEAVVYQHYRASVSDIWAQSRLDGTHMTNWALRQPDYQAPNPIKQEQELLRTFDQLAATLEATAGVTHDQVMVPLQRTIIQVARYSGYLQESLRLVARGVASEVWSNTLRARVACCNICGSRGFIPGPSQRMVRGRAPQCFQCGSLERHRVLGSLFGALDREELARWTCVSVGEALPIHLQWFARTRHVEFPDMKPLELPSCDLVVALNLQGKLGNTSIDDVISAMAAALSESGTMVLVDRVSDKIAEKAALDSETRIGQLLPNVIVRSTLAFDQVTDIINVVTVASPVASRVARIALRLARSNGNDWSYRQKLVTA